jgi:hypothetical protein
MNQEQEKTMKNTTSTLASRLPLPSLLLAGGMLLAVACSSTPGDQEGATPLAEKSGSELWAQNCRRCHNFRSPSEFSDSEWDAAMFHMRVRANLTGHEYEAILQFLKSSN